MNHHSLRAHTRILLSISVIFSSLSAYDNAHFYRATNFLFEPRLERGYLTSLDFFFDEGSTNKARNANHSTVPLLDIYGPSNMHELGVGVPGKDLSNPIDMILTQLALIPSACSDNSACCNGGQSAEFATFSTSGKFKITEGIFSFIQNWKSGFFFQIYLPIRKLSITDICFCDNSPVDSCPGTETLMWQVFKNNFPEILTRYELSTCPVTESGAGDTTVLLGWTHSYQKTEVLDFVDTSLRFGVLFPTGTKQNVNQVFSLPTGYGGSYGAVIDADFAFGAFDWLTLGAHIDAVVFGSHTRLARIKTAPYQSGMIKLAKAQASIEPGTILQAGTYFKADHFLRGLSILVGYTFASKDCDEIKPCESEKFSSAIANTDGALQSWKMHTLNFGIEYDFAQQYSYIGPRIGIFYNWVAGGKRIFTTNTAGGYLGLDMTWDFQ